MWGDPERALQLQDHDTAAVLLFQVVGPRHIPWQDPIWQELLLESNVWVHVEVQGGISARNNDDLGSSHHNNTNDQSQVSIMDRACWSLIDHARRTSNVAALAMHMTRLLRELMPTSSDKAIGAATISSGHNSSMTDQIARVGRARTTAGALNLFRILVHALQCHQHDSVAASHDLMSEVFTYTSRDPGVEPADVSADLLDALLQFLVSCHQESMEVPTLTPQQQYDQPMSPPPHTAAHAYQQSKQQSPPTLLPNPELYDTITLTLQLLLVLLSTQLYHPMQSSAQRIAAASDMSSTHPTSDSTRRSRTGAASQFRQTSIQSANGLFYDLLWHQARSRGRRKQQQQQPPEKSNWNHQDDVGCAWTSRQLLEALWGWHMDRPVAPQSSIQAYHSHLAQQVAAAKGERRSDDGWYESPLVVLASTGALDRSTDLHGDAGLALSRSATTSLDRRSSTSLILNATKGVLVLSSSIILLPFRLLSLALGLWGRVVAGGNGGVLGYAALQKQHLQQHLQQQHKHRTKDVLWLTESPVADLASSILLLLTNNERAEAEQNPFRMEMRALLDHRWETSDAILPDLPDLLARDTSFGGESDESGELESVPLVSAPTTSSSTMSGNVIRPPSHPSTLSLDFESLFSVFGCTVHSEVGSLLLYTLLQCSPAFADSVAVRSDLDTLVLPMIRTLYNATSTKYYAAQDYTTGARRSLSSNGGNISNQSGHGLSNAKVVNIRNCPFRSQSQLYVLVILLLLFSQDPSFGPDAFRRIHVPIVSWYRERTIKDPSLGSILTLVLLRALTFNLNRLRDAFLLSHCCAVLLNLSTSMTDLHDYVAMRLATVLVSSIKAFVKLRQQQQQLQQQQHHHHSRDHGQHTDYSDDEVHDDGDDDTATGDESDLSLPLAQHAEVARTLLRVVKQCLSSKLVDRNLHLIYSLVYHQADWNRIFRDSDCPFKKSEYHRIQSVMTTAMSILEEHGGNARTASRSLSVLMEHVDRIRNAVPPDRKSKHGGHVDGAAAAAAAVSADFTFTYEEEADPEGFFVPYVWEIIVCAVTSSSMEWNKERILVFPLLDVTDAPLDVLSSGLDINHNNSNNNSNNNHNVIQDNTTTTTTTTSSSSRMESLFSNEYANDVSDVV